MLWKAVDDYVRGIIRDSRRKKYKIQTLSCEEEDKTNVPTQFKSAITEVTILTYECVSDDFFNVKSLSVTLQDIIPEYSLLRQTSKSLGGDSREIET